MAIRKFLLLLIALITSDAMGWGQNSAAMYPARDAQGFVREVVSVELQAAAHSQPRWMYLLHKTNASGSKLTQIVETHQGLVGHLLEIDGQPLDAITERNEAHRLAELKRDPRQWKRKLARQERDRQRVMNIVRALPNAFVYSFAGFESGPFGKEARLDFRPNPHYSPDSLDTSILQSMSGALLIARQQRRLVRMQGVLGANVSIGLGIIGKLQKGGTLELRQSQIAPGSWQITKLSIAMTGRAVLRHIDVSVDESATEFQPVSSNLTVGEAIDLLLSQPRPH
ncbi:MAG: hypothetical protein ABI383_01510 [Acidobacteriaceae bacterium]